MPAKKATYIEWLDSYGCTSTWKSTEDISPVLLTCKTMGFVIHEDEKLIMIANSIADETTETVSQANGIMTIPKISIKKRKEIRL